MYVVVIVSVVAFCVVVVFAVILVFLVVFAVTVLLVSLMRLNTANFFQLFTKEIGELTRAHTLIAPDRAPD